ncbi:MAG: tRNA (cytidine(34)-2'-O)-methyltransferase [Bdellovibrionales bacterium]|nr:tRNA (cytidine(34)-2'-O)-methyltransferase [Bdellovibrionales bacterium]
MHVVLVHPDIPGNVGNIGRTCVAIGATLHLVKPMGFVLDDKKVKRAGLDYWQSLDLVIHKSRLSMERLLFKEQSPFLFSRFAEQNIWSAKFNKDSILVFGSETKGLPKAMIKKYQKQTYKIPMTGPVRSLNIASAAAVAIYEVLRQTM